MAENKKISEPLPEHVPLEVIVRMSTEKLKEYIKQMALENPLIDMKEQDFPVSQMQERKRKIEWLNQVDDSNRVYSQLEKDYIKNKDDWDVIPQNEKEDLSTYVKSQISPARLGEDTYHIVVYMIESLDSRGYLQESLEHIAEQFSVDMKEVQRCLTILQGLEPAGIGARDLKECLKLQLKRCKKDDPIARQIVSDYLDMVGNNEEDEIAAQMKCSKEEMEQYVQLIKSLNPKPGNGFASREHLAYLVPDLTVVKLEGYYEILVNEYLYPEISINEYYKNMMEQDCGPEVKQYLQGKLRQIQDLMDGIAKRNQLLIKIMNEIIKRQEVFFFTGKRLKRLRKTQLAQEMGIDLPIMVQAVRGKYIQCTWGIYPMAYFFAKDRK
ncbi:MAG: RNA polymerase sigma-54 factor [Clostridiales bacterium]|nr:RNA polymerase sigma-54 factor [Clostridiales bacterium]